MKVLAEIGSIVLAALVVVSASEAQQAAVVVDKLVADGGGHYFEARSVDTGRRYIITYVNCFAIPGEFFVIVVDPAKGMGTYATDGSFCLIREMHPVLPR